MASLLGLSKAGFKELLNFLHRNFERLNNRENALIASGNFSHLEQELAFSLFDALVPLCIRYTDSNVNAVEFLRSINRSFLATKAGQEVSAEDRGIISARLLEIFSGKSLRLKAKAMRLVNDFPIVWDHATIFSDIRPVFSSDGTPKLEAGVVLHTVRVVAQTDGEMKQYYFSADAGDLRALKELIERALKKETVLSKLLARSELAQIKVSS